MTKRLKLLWIGIFSAVMILCAAFLLFSQNNRSVFADGEEFNFTSGAYTSYAILAPDDNPTAFNGWAMAFELNKLTPKFDSLTNAPGGWWWWDTTPYLDYTFSFYRKNGENGEKLYTYKVKFEGENGDEKYKIRVERIKHVYTSAEIYLRDESFEPVIGKWYTETLEDGTKSRVHTYEVSPSTLDGQVNLPFAPNNKLKVVIEPESPYVEYYVTFDYNMFMWSSNDVGRDAIELSGSCQSSVRSLYTVFKNMEDLGVLRDNIESDAAYNNAYDTIHKKINVNAKITYLVPIEGTPFATTKTETAVVTVREDNDTLYADEASRVLGVYSFDCLQSYCDGFVKSEGSNNYKAHYYNNIWLKARTVDGNDYNYYLNINESYEEFYKHFVDAGIFDQGAYETVFSSQIYGEYSEQLNGYSPSTVYGYFGFAMIPKTYGINTLWKEFFNTETSQSGMVTTFEYGADVSLSSYNQLLEDYNYAFLKRIWNDAANLFTTGAEDTTCYILYAKPGTKSGFIAENGADDINDSSGAAQQPIDEIGEIIGGIGGSVLDGVKGVGTWLSGLSNKTKAIGTVLLTVCAVVLVIVIIRNKNKEN